MARHDTSKSPDELEEMRIKIGMMEEEQVEAKEVYRASLERLAAYKREYLGQPYSCHLGLQGLQLQLLVSM